MKNKKLPKLRVNKSEASEKIRSRINKGKKLFETQTSTPRESYNLERETRKWTDYNKTLFETLFDESPLSSQHGSTPVSANKIITHSENRADWINDLESIYEQLDLYEELRKNTQETMNRDCSAYAYLDHNFAKLR